MRCVWFLGAPPPALRVNAALPEPSLSARWGQRNLGQAKLAASKMRVRRKPACAPSPCVRAMRVHAQSQETTRILGARAWRTRRGGEFLAAKSCHSGEGPKQARASVAKAWSHESRTRRRAHSQPPAPEFHESSFQNTLAFKCNWFPFEFRV